MRSHPSRVSFRDATSRESNGTVTRAIPCYWPQPGTYAARTIVKMKETVLQNAPKVMYVCSYFCASTYLRDAPSKKLQFSTLTAQDVVRVSEFQVTHRDLYTTTDRAPVKDGVLDRRLVSSYPPYPFYRYISCSVRVHRRRMHSARPAGSMRSTVSVTTPTSSLSSLSFILGISSTQSPSSSAFAKYAFTFHRSPLLYPF